MRQYLHHLHHVQRRAITHEILVGGSRGRRREGLHGLFRLTHLGGNLLGQLTVPRVAGTDCDDVPEKGAAQQRQVSEDVQNLVPHELVLVAQRLGGQHRVIADDHGVLQAPALDQPVLVEQLQLLEEAERSRVGEFLGPGLRRHFEAEELREAPAAARARAGNLQPVVGEHLHHRLAHLQLQRLRQPIRRARLRLWHQPGLLNHPHILARTPIRNRRLTRIQLDDGIVHARAAERREHMLHRVNLHVPLAQRGGTIRIHNVLHPRLDLGFAVEVHPPEAHAGAGRGGQERHVDPAPAVEADTRKGDRFP